MILSIETPAILFPAITLLMLAYTNRFLALSQLIRTLHHDYQNLNANHIVKQINHLRFRLFLIRLMQSLGAIALILCIISIFSLLMSYQSLGTTLFIGSLIIFLGSIISSLIEILLSTRALNVLLVGFEDSQQNSS
ncbi:MAG: II family cellulose-binding protein [Rickettsiales bacterium]|nr:II family cellulose-binding protein [Rickettsiales bacterium]|tara:strand:- start:7755 stop:8162 length:408 start_codon:yes stop_codon:yes gene_type:complete